LLSNLERKNCWTVAEERGDVTPHGLQHMLSRASWDEDAVSDDVRDDVTTAFADPDAVLVVDETGDLKKGAATAGVRRQYTGTRDAGDDDTGWRGELRNHCATKVGGYPP
jgi:SRSO17 transposase